MTADPPASTERTPERAAANMTATALAFAVNARAGGWGDLDFSFRSIGLLDPIIESTGRKADLIKTIVTPAAIYLGEVILDFCGGSRDTADPVTVLRPADARSDAEPLECGRIATKRLFDTTPVGARVRAVLRTWYGRDFVPNDPIDASRLPDAARRRAQAFVYLAGRDFGIDKLDYSPASLDLVDRFIQDRIPGDPRANLAFVAAAGAYVGEVLIATTGAHWTLTPDRQFAVELRGIAFPADKVAKAIAGGQKQSVAYFYREVSTFWQSGSSLPPANWKVTKPPKPPKRRLFGR